MRVLLIKTSSMGDVIHTFPALHDAGLALPNIRFDWVVEDVFAEIPRWHPLVENIIPVALRRWRKNIFASATRSGWRELRLALNVQNYDVILDAQSLVKSAFLTLFARGQRAGLDWKSARESLASFAYQKKYTVNFYQHAVTRMRQLFSQALNYPLLDTFPNFDLSGLTRESNSVSEKYIMFLHGTTWTTKLWPEEYWKKLACLVADEGFYIKICAGNSEELSRAKRIAENNSAIEVLPRLEISTMAKILANASAAIAVDTGFGHLSAALDVPTVSLYGATNPEFTGALGRKSIHLSAKFECAPCLARRCHYTGKAQAYPACYTTLMPEYVWNQTRSLMLKN